VSDSLAIRRLTTEDAAAFRTLRLEGLEREPLAFRWSLDDEVHLPLERTIVRLQNDHVVGALVGGALVGIAGLTRQDGTRLRHNGLLWGLYVREEARKRGVGRALVARLLDVASSLVLATVHLTVLADNGPAQQLYERMGFVTYGTAPGYVQHGEDYLDERMMVRRLE
jgi:ribosomal protein S18 acetylase RimI-like enzyme